MCRSKHHHRLSRQHLQTEKYHHQSRVHTIINNYHQELFIKYRENCRNSPIQLSLQLNITVNLIQEKDNRIIQTAKTNQYGQYRSSNIQTHLKETTSSRAKHPTKQQNKNINKVKNKQHEVNTNPEDNRHNQYKTEQQHQRDNAKNKTQHHQKHINESNERKIENLSQTE